MAEEFEPYTNISPIENEKVEVTIDRISLPHDFEKHRGFVDLEEGVLYQYNPIKEVKNDD